MLDVQQRRRNTKFIEPRGTSVERLLAIFFQTRFQQLIFRRHPAQNRAVPSAMQRSILCWSQHLADFQSAAGADNHAASTWIGNSVDRRKSADVAHQSDAHIM